MGMVLKQKAESMVLEKQRALMETIEENEKAKLREVKQLVCEAIGVTRLEKKAADLKAEIENKHRAEAERTEAEYRAAVDREKARYTKDLERVTKVVQELTGKLNEADKKAQVKVVVIRQTAQGLRDRIRTQTRDTIDGIWFEALSPELQKMVKALPTPDELKADGLKKLLPTRKEIDALPAPEKKEETK